MRQFLLLKNQFQSAIAAQRDSMPDMRNRHRTMSAGMSAGVSFIVVAGSTFFPEDISPIFFRCLAWQEKYRIGISGDSMIFRCRV